MGIASQEPDPGPKNGHQRWTYLSVKNGTTTCGFLAAYPFGVWCHHSHGSKPCRLRVSEGALVCPRCNPDDQPEWRGFTAIWSREYVPLFCIITKDYLESVREIPIGAQVKISRGNKVYDPVVIRPDNWRTLPLPPSPERSKPVDLLPSLLRMWKDAELNKWHSDTVSRVAKPDVPTPAVDVPPEIAARMRSALPPSAEQIEAKLDDVIANLTHKGRSLRRGKPSPNGTHPPASDD